MPHGKSPTHRRAARRRRAATRGRADAPRPPPEPGSGAVDGPVRLQKLIAAAGLGSRRAAEEYLRAGRVTVNGERAQLGDSADPRRDVVAVDGEPLAVEKSAYWMLHKPQGVVTTLRDPQQRRTVRELLPPGVPQLHPVGRLDYASTGLVLMTNDGALTHALLHPSLGNEREYRVTVRGALSDKARSALERGVVLEEGRTAPGRVDRVEIASDGRSTVFHLTLVEGRNRQIRRSLLALGHPVKKLVRVRLGPLRLGSLQPGGARSLTRDEVVALRAHARHLASGRD